MARVYFSPLFSSQGTYSVRQVCPLIAVFAHSYIFRWSATFATCRRHLSLFAIPLPLFSNLPITSYLQSHFLKEKKITLE